MWDSSGTTWQRHFRPHVLPAGCLCCRQSGLSQQAMWKLPFFTLLKQKQARQRCAAQPCIIAVQSIVSCLTRKAHCCMPARQHWKLMTRVQVFGQQICSQFACTLAVLPNMLIASTSLVQHIHCKDSYAYQVRMKDSHGGIQLLSMQTTYVVAAIKHLRLNASSTQHKHANNMQHSAKHANFAATMHPLLR